MKMREHPIIVRSVRSEFVRIVGLKECERDKLAGRLRRVRNVDCSISTVIQYGLYGWLEVREGGLFRHPYEERVKLTNALKDGVLKIVNAVFPQK
jgi:hypothetical protein